MSELTISLKKSHQNPELLQVLLLAHTRSVQRCWITTAKWREARSKLSRKKKSFQTLISCGIIHITDLDTGAPRRKQLNHRSEGKTVRFNCGTTKRQSTEFPTGSSFPRMGSLQFEQPQAPRPVPHAHCVPPQLAASMPGTWGHCPSFVSSAPRGHPVGLHITS